MSGSGPNDDKALLDIIGALTRPNARVLIVTGAGISSAAGLPTYRGAGGLYPSGAIPLQATDARSRNLPDLWARLADLIDGARVATPTPAHRAIAEHLPHATVVTQNVDGLHETAGTTEVLAMHGSLGRARCIKPGADHRHPTPHDVGALAADIPRCPTDGARLRPDIVLFGESLNASDLARAVEAAKAATVVLVVGTSLQVHPVAGLVTTALNAGATGAWFDVDPATMLNRVDADDYASFQRLMPVPGDLQEILPAVLSRLGAQHSTAR